jgi:hypothetical protein
MASGDLSIKISDKIFDINRAAFVFIAFLNDEIAGIFLTLVLLCMSHAYAWDVAFMCSYMDLKRILLAFDML